MSGWTPHNTAHGVLGTIFDWCSLCKGWKARRKKGLQNMSEIPTLSLMTFVVRIVNFSTGCSLLLQLYILFMEVCQQVVDFLNRPVLTIICVSSCVIHRKHGWSFDATVLRGCKVG